MEWAFGCRDFSHIASHLLGYQFTKLTISADILLNNTNKTNKTKQLFHYIILLQIQC